MKRLFKAVALSLCVAISAFACAPTSTLIPVKKPDGSKPVLKAGIAAGPVDVKQTFGVKAASSQQTQPFPGVEKTYKKGPAEPCAPNGRLTLLNKKDISAVATANQSGSAVLLKQEASQRMAEVTAEQAMQDLYIGAHTDVGPFKKSVTSMFDGLYGEENLPAARIQENIQNEPTFKIGAEGTASLGSAASSAAFGAAAIIEANNPDNYGSTTNNISTDGGVIATGGTSDSKSTSKAEGGDGGDATAISKAEAEAKAKAEAEAKAKADAEIKGPKKPGGCDHGDCDKPGEIMPGRGGTRGIVSQPYTPK